MPKHKFNIIKEMQPRFPFPGVPPGVPGVPPGVMPPPMAGFPPPPGYPGFYTPAGMPMPPPPHMMHPSMVPAHMGAPPSLPPMGMPPPPVFNPPAFAASAPAPPPPKPAAASSSVIVGAPVMRVAAAAPPTPAAGSVPTAPPVPAPIVMVSANSAIHDFNYSNPSAVFLSATSTLVNKHIFQNPAAALPLTVYIGQVPLDMPEAVLMKILESCGKIFKLARPVDPASQLPAAFALATYSQGLCAVRCVKALNGYLVDEEEDVRLVVKMGTKEAVAVESIMKAEDEASAELPEGHSLEKDIYDAIRANVADTLTAMRNPVPVGPAAALAVAGAGAGAEGGTAGVSANPNPSTTPAPPSNRPPPPTTKRPDAIEAGEITEDGEEAPSTQAAGNTNGSSTTPVGAAGATGNYYNRLDGLIESTNSSGVVITATLAEQVAVDEAGEKMLMSEIERFRLRQLQRDKEKEEERKMKVKQKMQEMKELAQRKAEREARALAEGIVDAAAASFNGAAAGSSHVPGSVAVPQGDTGAAAAMAGGKRRSEEVSAEELEIKRRRKLQVLQMLAGGAEEGEERDVEAPTAAAEGPTSAPAPAQVAAGAAGDSGASTGAVVGGLGLATKRMGVKKAAPGRTTFTSAEDEEDVPKKAMILLDYTEEELREMAQQTQQYLAHPDDFESLEEDFSGKKRNLLAGLGVSVPTTGAAPDMTSIQAKVRAQAQAISAALALKIAQGGAAAGPAPAATTAAPVATSSVPGAGSGAGVDKTQLKSLVDRIPTEKDELFAYPLNWAALDAANIVTDVMAAWVSTKIAEYLGEEEPQLRDFIVGKLRGHCKPADLLEELAVVMDEAAEPFVVKLWRMLVYYSVKNA